MCPHWLPRVGFAVSALVVPLGMTDFDDAPDIVDDGTSDVMAEDEVVHVPAGGAELAESIEHAHETGSFITDVPAWDEPDPLP